ncbi:putative beta-glucosidase 41-like [Capsicum annuum]|nr:putative beta-glucosidase 41-like [Capsicum annuum]KAF3626112.1 putative beta-glucosidase 41-like [Capsicum annuum]
MEVRREGKRVSKKKGEGISCNPQHHDQVVRSFFPASDEVFFIRGLKAVAKVAGVTVKNNGFHSVTAEHPVYTTTRNVVRPVFVSTISLSSEDVKSGVVTVVNGGGGEGLSDMSLMQKVVAEFDDWEMAGGEEEIMVSVGKPLSKVVFSGAPSLQEATEATSDL